MNREQLERMVYGQVRVRGIGDRRILQAMVEVDRKEFIPAEYREWAYADRPVPIGFEQTISQPFTVAFMINALELTGKETVLNVGSGSGYAAAILAMLVDQVYAVEVVKELAEKSVETLKRLGIENVRVREGDGRKGWKSKAPFDAILVDASGDKIPQDLVDQLAVRARLVMPVRDRMVKIRKTNKGIEKEDLGGFSFVKLV